MLTIARTVVNTAYRMLYPFLPTIARGLGVSLESITLAITLRSSLGLFSPVFGLIADRRGRKTAMLIGLLLFTGALLLVAVWPTYPALFLSILLVGVSKIIFDPAIYAHLGDRVPYQRRGLAIALTEFGWSGAFLVGIPIVGWLIARGTWTSAFPWLAGAGAVIVFLIWRAIPQDGQIQGHRPSLRQGLGAIFSHPPAMAGLAISLLITASNETVNIVFGAWMEGAFGMQVAALGAASAIIGIAELSGEGLVAALVDRLGKLRALSLGLALYALASFMLPTFGALSVEGALVGLFLFYITFEFALVSAIPLMSELVPGARATLLAGNVTAHSLGRVVGSILGPVLFPFGLAANTAASMIMVVIALMTLFIFMRGADASA